MERLSDLYKGLEVYFTRLERTRERDACRWPLLYGCIASWQLAPERVSTEVIRPLANTFVCTFEQLPEVVKWAVDFHDTVKVNDALETVLALVHSAAITVEETVEENYTTLIAQSGDEVHARALAALGLRSRFHTPFVLVSKIRPGRCRYTYQLPLSSFLAEVTSLRSIKVKAVDVSPSVSAVLRDPAPRSREASLLKLAQHHATDAEAELVFSERKRRAQEWLVGIGVRLEAAQQALAVSSTVFGAYTVYQLFVEYASTVPRDTADVMALCSDALQAELARFLAAFPDVIDARTWLLEYVADCFWVAAVPVLLTPLPAPGVRFMTLRRPNKRPPLPAVLLPTASDADLDLAKSLQHVANLLGIGGVPASSNRRWYHGCSRATAEHVLNSIDPSRFQPSRDFGLQPSFHVGESYPDAVTWAFRKCNASGAAVVVFDVPEADRVALDPTVSLGADEDSWAELVRDSRRGERSAATKRADRAEWVSGPEAAVTPACVALSTWRPLPRQPLAQQLAIKGDGAVDLFDAHACGLVLLVHPARRRVLCRRQLRTRHGRRQRLTGLASTPCCRRCLFRSCTDAWLVFAACEHTLFTSY